MSPRTHLTPSCSWGSPLPPMCLPVAPACLQDSAHSPFHKVPWQGPEASALSHGLIPVSSASSETSGDAWGMVEGFGEVAAPRIPARGQFIQEPGASSVGWAWPQRAPTRRHMLSLTCGPPALGQAGALGLYPSCPKQCTWTRLLPRGTRPGQGCGVSPWGAQSRVHSCPHHPR